MPTHRHLLIPALWLLLACAALAQNRPAPARAVAPAPNCLVSEFRAMALGTHDVAERGQRAADWMRRNAADCSEEQLRVLSANRAAWLGTADSTQLMATIDGALEARLKNRPELLAQMFGSSPARVAASETLRAGELAPRPAPVVAAGTPAVVAAAPQVVVAGTAPAMPAGAAPRPSSATPSVPAAGSTPNPPGASKAPEMGKYFDDKLRGAVREHFTANRGSGACPPGVTLKSGRCESPQSERAWKQGQPLPATLSAKDLPAALQKALGPAPAGHAYVQVDADLLLINTSTRVVVDAVMDLGQVPPKA
jgi:Ni/Co efflux regulator RcnB